jgi:hypothetical protein
MAVTRGTPPPSASAQLGERGRMCQASGEWRVTKCLADTGRFEFSGLVDSHYSPSSQFVQRGMHASCCASLRHGVPLWDCIRSTAMKIGTAANAAATQNTTSAGTEIS